MSQELADQTPEEPRERLDKKTLAEAFREAARRGLPTRVETDENPRWAFHFRPRDRRKGP
jgi:hypothetical protein